MPKVFEPKNPNGWNELTSEWVTFHDGKQYLLPVILREQTMQPVFTGDTVTIKQHCNDDKLGPLVDGYIQTVLEVGDTGAIQSEETLANFFGLIRHLLLRNYSFTDEQLSSLLTVTNKQVSILFGEIAKHVVRK